MLRPERQVSLSRASLVPCRAKPYDARAMARVRGDGGIFFKSKNPEALRAWYAKHLGIVSEGDQGTGFRWHQADSPAKDNFTRSEEHTSELQSRFDLVCRLLLE